MTCLVALSSSQQRGDYGGGRLTISDPAVFLGAKSNPPFRLMDVRPDQPNFAPFPIAGLGMTGIPIVLGDIHPAHRRVVQVGGSALRISTQAFRHLLEVSESLRGILLNYVQVV